MTAEKTTEITVDTQQGLLSEYKKQRDQLEMQLQLMNGQVAMQELFVDTRALITQFPDSQRAIEGEYAGQPAMMDIVECMTENTSDSRGVNVRDNARFIVYAKADEMVLCDLAITRPQNRESWNAMVGDYHAKVTRRGGNPGVDWRTASGLVEGEKKSPAGLSTEVHDVIKMVKGILSQPKK